MISGLKLSEDFLTGNYFNLGGYSRPVTTSSKQAQIWFDRGLNWCYGFNQEEAVRCFKQAIELDPKCAMGYWGVAYAAGPFYNKPWDLYGEQERVDAAKFCYQYSRQAFQLKDKVSLVEQRIIEALCRKHPADHGNLETEMPRWSRDYAAAMRRVLTDFSDDLDIICLTAEALMLENFRFYRSEGVSLHPSGKSGWRGGQMGSGHQIARSSD